MEKDYRVIFPHYFLLFFCIISGYQRQGQQGGKYNISTTSTASTKEWLSNKSTVLPHTS